MATFKQIEKAIKDKTPLNIAIENLKIEQEAREKIDKIEIDYNKTLESLGVLRL